MLSNRWHETNTRPHYHVLSVASALNSKVSLKRNAKSEKSFFSPACPPAVLYYPISSASFCVSVLRITYQSDSVICCRTTIWIINSTLAKGWVFEDPSLLFHKIEAVRDIHSDSERLILNKVHDFLGCRMQITRWN